MKGKKEFFVTWELTCKYLDRIKSRAQPFKTSVLQLPKQSNHPLPVTTDNAKTKIINFYWAMN